MNLPAHFTNASSTFINAITRAFASFAAASFTSFSSSNVPWLATPNWVISLPPSIV